MSRFIILCDLHLPQVEDAVQYDAFNKAIEKIKEQEADALVVVGDITARGEKNAMEYFLNKLESITIPKVVLLGNSDVRNEENIPFMDNVKSNDKTLFAEEREIICINTPFGSIEERDRKRLDKSARNAVLVMHHSVTGLKKESRDYIFDWAEKRVGLILQAHSHKEQHYYISGTEVIGLGALDPEKAIGTPPCINILDVGDDITLKKEFLQLETENMSDFKQLLGISCFNPLSDIDYATEKKIKCIEVRKYETNTDYQQTLTEKIKKWRTSGGKTLSIHMPNLWYRDGKIDGLEEWEAAITLAQNIGVDSMTVHVPRILRRDFKGMEKTFLDIYVRMIEKMPQSTSIAIENLHAHINEKDDENCAFGYTPEEVIGWVDSINKIFGFRRAGHNLDVGHAKNNPPFRSKYTLGVWYSMIGKRTEAYHIHQVKDSGMGSPNHKAILDWFGPQINYFSFFMAWNKGQINHRPMFMEMRDIKNCIKSYESLEKINLFGR